MIRSSLQGILFAGLVVALINCGASAFATPPGGFGVPEISPTAASSAIAILAGSGLMLAERLGFRRK
ncbi:MAG: hypothetical protein SFV81_20620 [Pirellulaceae bacterium]|nr:hypothetical protein [Pirellulaceae bacterium]